LVDLDWSLICRDPETCVCARDCDVVCAFGGTAKTEDLHDDHEIALGQVFPRAKEAERWVAELIRLNSTSLLNVELAGHLSGGAVAREVGKALGLEAVTFDAAAPPSAPVISGIGHVDCHAVHDVVSIWQSPDAVCIDKGFRPGVSSILGFAFGMEHIWACSMVSFLCICQLTSLMCCLERSFPVLTRMNLFRGEFISLPLKVRTVVLGFPLGLGPATGVSAKLPVIT